MPRLLLALALLVYLLSDPSLPASAQRQDESIPMLAGPASCHNSTGRIPLNDLGAGSYQGKQGGLYPGGQNVPPPAYLNAGKAKAAQVQPINGKIVILAQGFSNPYQEFPAFQALAASDPAVNPAVVTVNGAMGGQDAWEWQDPSDDAWANAKQQLAARGVGEADVQVIWFKTVRIQSPTTVLFPTDAQQLQKYTRAWVANMEDRYPNLKLIYISTRTYAGNAQVGISTEPRAYQTGFAAKWLIEERINGATTGPAWLGWGPYLWADGTKPRSDGLTWPCNEFDADGVHPGPAMEAKVGKILLDFFKSDPTTRPWFLANASPEPTATLAPPTATLAPPTATQTPTPTATDTPTPTMTPEPTATPTPEPARVEFFVPAEQDNATSIMVVCERESASEPWMTAGCSLVWSR